ncbi:hypothetical protein TGME49_217720 [Toxoplasma gondii ME49]|uniref:Transmembrane protein n=3 Tax=Toxoplasma gondii TaxID=5811 RepID=A0A125YZE3_TOXGV|nr:hypothetical protein TGME49_217720 [Toxoplasma gondii ME49]EPT24753.1 hypothetical protein TGME49_217720 [Toxoplasma gondii ME49]ESS34087.1 putative transmembrane protein [Toxoplasma gondii VEG]|eukprot:XP_018634865.1 hypothetical protein TGME49_217720 [Toxoplasma gondii ME49]
MAFKGMCLAEGMSSKRVLRNALLLAPFLSASLVPGVVVQREGTFVTAASTPPREAHANFLDRGVGEGDSDQYPLLTGGVNDSFMLTGEQEQDEQQQNTLVNLNVGYGGEHGHDMPQFAVQGAIEGENREEQPNRSMNHHFYERRGMGKRRAGRGRKSGIARRHSSETRNRSTIATIAVQTIIAVGVLAAGATFALRQLAEVRRAAVDAEKAALLEIQRKHKEEAVSLRQQRRGRGARKSTCLQICALLQLSSTWNGDRQ